MEQASFGIIVLRHFILQKSKERFMMKTPKVFYYRRLHTSSSRYLLLSPRKQTHPYFLLSKVYRRLSFRCLAIKFSWEQNQSTIRGMLKVYHL